MLSQSSRVLSFTPAPPGEEGFSDLVGVVRRFGAPLYTLALPSLVRSRRRRRRARASPELHRRGGGAADVRVYTVDVEAVLTLLP